MTAAIVDFRPDHAAAWAHLNTAWLIEGGFATRQFTQDST